MTRFAHRRGLFLWLTVFSAMSIADITLGFCPPLVLISVAVFKATVLTLAFALILGHRRWLDIICYVFIALYSLASAVNFAGYVFYDMGISRGLFIIILQTNTREVTEFSSGIADNLFEGITSWKFLLAATAILGMWFILRRVTKKFYLIAIAVVATTGAFFFVTAMTTRQIGRTLYFMSVRVPKFAVEAWQAQRAYDSMMTHPNPFPNPESVKSSHATADILLIIGESASSSHHSLYGYPLATTPRLSAMRDSLFVFTDVIGASSSTVPNIERIMSFMRDSDVDVAWSDYPSVFDLFRNAGYTTYFLSNQEKYGAASGQYTLDGVLSAQADNAVFTGQISARDIVNNRFDALLLPEVDKALADSAEARFLVLHLLGSHQLYRERYPAEFSHFTADDELSASLSRPWLTESTARIVAEYDNSILYNDSIIEALIQRFRRSPRPSLLIYLSDHGEDVYDTGNHLMRTVQKVDVPFIIYANSAWLYANPTLARDLGTAVDRPFSTANLIHTLMSLSGTSYCLYDSTLDVISPDFRPRHRYVNGRPAEYYR